MSGQGQQDQGDLTDKDLTGKRGMSSDSQYASTNTTRGRNVFPSSPLARNDPSPGHSEHMRRLFYDAGVSLQQQRGPGNPLNTSREPSQAHFTPAVSMAPFPGTDTLWNCDPPRPSHAANPHQGIVPRAFPPLDERAARIHAWLDNIVDEDLFTADAVADPSSEPQLEWHGTKPTQACAEAHTSTSRFLRRSPEKEHTSPHGTPSAVHPFETQLPTRPLNPPSQAKSQSSDFGFMTQPFPTIKPTQPPPDHAPATRPRSGAVTGTGPPILPTSGVEGLSPHVTPYRKHSRPRRPTFRDYYDEDIIKPMADKEKNAKK